MTILGLDIGYRNTNITNGEATITFPSTIALTRGTQGETLPGSSSSDILTLNGQSYLVGEAAENHSRFSRATLNRFRVESDEYKVLFLYALYRLFGKGKQGLKIVTGLPDDDLMDRGKVIKLLQGTHRLKVNGKSLTYKVNEVMVIPQPLGTLMSEIFKLDNGKLITINPDLKTKPCLVVDFGGLTTGLMHFAGGYSSDKSGSIEVGIANYAIKQLQADIKASTGAKISFSAAEEALSTGTCLIASRPTDVSKLVDVVLDEVAHQAASQARNLWDDAASDEYMFLTGGGALLLADRFKRLYGRSGIRKVRNPHLANVQGFYLFGLGMREEGKW